MVGQNIVIQGSQACNRVFSYEQYFSIHYLSVYGDFTQYNYYEWQELIDA